MREEALNVTLFALEPQELFDSAWAQDVVPHHARVGERVQANVAAVAGEGVLGGEDRVAAAEEVHRVAPGEGARHVRGSLVEHSVLALVGVREELACTAQEFAHRSSPWEWRSVQLMR